MSQNRAWSLLILSFAMLSGCNSSAKQLLEQAEARWREGNYEDALHLNTLLYNRDHQGRYAAQALLNIGSIYYLNQRQIKKAIETYNKVVEEFPGRREEITARQQLAAIYANEMQVRDLAQVIEQYDKILEDYPDLENKSEVQYLRANAYFNMGEYESALRELRRIEEVGMSGHVADQVYLKIGNIYQIQKKFDNAAEMFQKVAEAACMDCRRRAILHLTESYEALFQIDKAIETLHKLDRTPENEAWVSREIARLTKKRQSVGSATSLSWDWRHR